MKIRKFICKLIGHRSNIIFSYLGELNNNWVYTTTVYKCERCGEENRFEYQASK